MPRIRHAANVTALLDIAVLPAEAAEMEADCYIVVDVLRATTTIAMLFESGLEDLVVTNDIMYARDLGKSEKRMLFGEVHGLAPDGFDYGNSPIDAAEAPVAGRGAVLFTTNGTPAICSVAGKGAVFAGALSNIAAVTTAAIAFESVVVVCAGNAVGRRFSQEDFAAAGSIVRAILRKSPAAELGDAASIAMSHTGYDDWLRVGLPQQTESSARLIGGSTHARRTIALGLAADVQFSTRQDTSSAVPAVVEQGPNWARLRRLS